MSALRTDGAGRSGSSRSRPARPGPAGLTPDAGGLHRRTVASLVGSQIAGGIGTSSGIAVAALAAESLGGPELSGLGQTAAVLGSALAAVPLSRLMSARGRRPGLATGYLVAAVGAVVCIVAGQRGLFWLFLVGMLLVGPATAANLQARYAATDLASDRNRARSLSIVVAATTVGVILGPNLIEPGASLAGRLGLPELFGPYVFALAAYLLATVIVTVRLRPDPLLTARAIATPSTPGADVPSGPVRPGTAGSGGAVTEPGAKFGVLRLIATTPGARIGVLATAVAHSSMVAVMAMTPVHLLHGGATLSVVGLAVSMHIAGMYALSPLFGWLADSIGRGSVIAAGLVLTIVATMVTGTAPANGAGQVCLGLTVLGVGWSCCLVGGSTLLSESVEIGVRPAVQGVADLIMGLSAAGASALAGLVIGAWGYGVLNGLAGAMVGIPLLIVLLRGRAFLTAESPA
jgi:MFS family permease